MVAALAAEWKAGVEKWICDSVANAFRSGGWSVMLFVVAAPAGDGAAILVAIVETLPE